MKKLFISLMVLSLATFAAQGQVIPKSYLCYHASAPITIDGKLNDAAWQKAPWTDIFLDIQGDKFPEPRFETRAKMLWDEKNFYIAAKLEEPHVWATIAKRDDVIFHDNDFEVFMDPDGDNFEYGEFEINALNTGWDLFLPKPYKDGGHAVDSWNIAGIKTAVFVNGTLNNAADTDSGWTVEIAMPWASLEKISHTRQAPVDGQQWHVNFSRVEWPVSIVDGKYVKMEGRPEDNWVWSSQEAIDMHRPERWGIVQFTTKTEGNLMPNPDPYAAARLILHQVYYAEKDFHKDHNRWTDKGNELPIFHMSGMTQIALNDSGYTASIDLYGSYAHIRQDSYFWVDSTQTR